jgi:hypothetical protein
MQNFPQSSPSIFLAFLVALWETYLVIFKELVSHIAGN